MMGDDEEHKRVVKEQQELSNQVAALRERRALLLRELESVDSEIETAEHRQKNHAAQSARVIANYERKMKAMSNGGDSKIKSAYEATRKTLEGCKGSKEFLEWLKGESATCLSERDGKVQSDLLQTRRQLVGFVRQHLDLLLESLELVSRRSKFCESKLASMRDELAGDLRPPPPPTLSISRLSLLLRVKVSAFGFFWLVSSCLADARPLELLLVPSSSQISMPSCSNSSLCLNLYC